MNNKIRILAVCLFSGIVLTVSAQDKQNMFNPVNTSVTSQTIAPDARAPVWVMPVWQPTLTWFRNTGTRPSIRSPSRVRASLSTIHRGCDSLSAIWTWPIWQAITA